MGNLTKWFLKEVRRTWIWGEEENWVSVGQRDYKNII